MGFLRTKKSHLLWSVPLSVLVLACLAFAIGKSVLNAFRPEHTTPTFHGVNDHRPAPPTNLRVSIDGVPQPEPFDISVTVPDTIRIDQTSEVTFKLVNPTAVTTEAGLNVPIVDSPAFDIKGPNPVTTNPNVMEWEWLLTPKRTGSQKISLQIPATYPNLNLPGSPQTGTGAESGSQKEYVFDVQVVNELGLTARESALLAALAAAQGVIGTVTGYPFLKRYFEPNGKAGG